MPDEIVPPAPERRPTVLVAHGDERVDDWYWLRDRDDPAVLAHLKAENAYADACLAGQAALRQTLYDEMVARIAETDLSVPVRRGPWWYYHRTEEKKSYPIHCRRPAVDDVPLLDSGPAADEQVLLDENELAEGLAFFEVANLAVSPDHGWLAYATDTTGGEIFDLTFRRLADEAGAAPTAATPGPEAAPIAAEVPETVHDTYYGLAWAADNATVFYTASTTRCARTSCGGTASARTRQPTSRSSRSPTSGSRCRSARRRTVSTSSRSCSRTRRARSGSSPPATRPPSPGCSTAAGRASSTG